jgi:alginate O-acetyltransferase complex protein AlgI
MIFNSFQFVFFFLIVTISYFVLPHKYRWGWLLAASCYFYMVFVPVYILILGFTIVVDYFAGRLIENESGKRRRLFLIMSLIANIGVLAIFKYYNFLNDNLSALLHGVGYQNPIPYLSILLPIGLSFHTFQAMSYTIEVYRGHQKAEKHFGIYALYVMFFPQLVAGPIERPQNMIHQFHERHFFDYQRISDGLKLMLWGFFKKLVVADRLSIFVDAIYNNADYHSGVTLLVATIFFSIQIYTDFSAYSDIAKGSAKVLGFELMTNFKRPYFSTSVSEFWSRWHISLSTWFRDYLYISMGGNRVSVPRWYFNLFFVFLISGLWHGANWTFLIWGALNGFYLIMELVLKKPLDRFQSIIGLNKLPSLKRIIQTSITFLLICLAFLFFRANSVSHAWLIIKKIVSLNGPLYIGDTRNEMHAFVYSVLVIVLLFCIEWVQEYRPGKWLVFRSPNIALRYLSYACLLIIILLIGVFDGGQFIYFQF